MKWKLVTRRSPLALAQVQEVLSSLPEAQRSQFEVIEKESYGDKNLGLSLLDSQAPDFFTRELDQALLNREADLAVHSAKDLPLPLPEGLELLALTKAQDPRDALVLAPGAGSGLRDLKQGARIGTSSASRRDQLLAERPDLNLISLRGNIGQRLAQVDSGELDGIVVAYCALIRLGLEKRASEILNFATHPLQGALALVGRSGSQELKELWAPWDVRKHWGRVYIAGAGPGHPDLVTLKTWKLIARAQIIFHDALVDPSLLDAAPGELVFVGKRRGQHEKRQEEINELLYQAALQGKEVLRLKGGDPLLFGRGSEESDYLAQRLVSYEIWPGVTSASGAAAFGEIPLTERGVAASVAFCLGWPAEKLKVPDTDTRVYFMAGGTLDTLVLRHREKGFDDNLPVCLVSNATLPSQKVWRMTLGQLEARLKDALAETFPTPLLVITGKTAGRSAASWWNLKPRVLYTGTDPQRLNRDARLEHRPFIALKELPLTPQKREILEDFLRRKDGWILFTSRKTVEVFGKWLKLLGRDSRSLGPFKVAAVGRATAGALEAQGIVPDLVPARESSWGLVEAFGGLGAPETPTLLLPRSDKALDILPAELTGLGYRVIPLVLYSNLPLSNQPLTAVQEAPALDLAEFDEVLLTSPSSAQAFLDQYPALPLGLKLTSMGEQTEAYLRDRLAEKGNP